ncbi:hypothetical protein [Streptomyces clavifer]|uniref:hypothetical protein n=1 Tax=Streptomyces clavifer TaxID=68188 RepID=UPI002E815608|nr:hypothetical protein [Streptomyces clavifer]WRY80857.1 hypothetical protein OG388_06315 [Streptomyces clavifer]WUC26617.1 hypothetical protein OG927_04220 [Streptomyces clavifer]
MRPTWAAQALRDTTIEYVTTTSALAEPDPRALGHAPEEIYRRSAAGGAGKGRVRALIAATPGRSGRSRPDADRTASSATELLSGEQPPSGSAVA